MTKENQLNSLKTNNDLIDYVLLSIECFTFGKVKGVNKDSNTLNVEMSYKLRNNNKISNNMIAEFPAISILNIERPYEVGDEVAIFFPKVNQNAFLDGGSQILNLKEKETHSFSNGVVFFNITKANLQNNDSYSLKFGDCVILIKKDNSGKTDISIKNEKTSLEMKKDGTIKLSNNNAVFDFNNAGLVGLKNNQMSLFQLMTDIINVLTPLAPLDPSGSAASMLQVLTQDINKLLKS